MLAVTRVDDVINSRLSLGEVSTPPKSFAEALRGLSDGQSEFDSRQKRLHDAYESFKNQLTPQMATVVLDTFHLDEIRTILRVTPELAHSWTELIRGATVQRRRALRNFGIYVACALTYGDMPSKGIELLALLQEGSSFVQVRYTLATLPLETVALWWSADASDVNRLRFARLDACSNDQELAVEAAAALYANKASILSAYVHDRMTSPLPVDVARAITVAGFSNDAHLVSEVTIDFDGQEGLLVTAARASRYAMERHQWSMHWFNKMLAARTEEDFWTASVLFLKVVDGRFEAEYREPPIGTEIFNRWWWSVERRLKRRFNKWADKRKKILFGAKVPDAIYLPKAQ
ncbi:hypothetical protein FQZ97_817300 [compost metagenome]